MIDAAFFTRNRTKLEQELAGVEAVVLSAHTSMQLVGDAAAPFRQESNFWYLTGIAEPDWLLVLSKGKSWLVAPDVSEAHRIFDGGMSAKEAQMRSGVDTVIDAAAAAELLAQLAAQVSVVGSLGEEPHAKHYSFWLNPARDALWQRLARQFTTVQDIRPEVARLRAIKEPSEIEAITRAVNVTVQSFQDAKQNLTQLTHEYQLEAEFTAVFRRQNAQHAYEPIVAGGGNACTLHYVHNSDPLTKSSFVLIDIGARLDGYAADVTRTYAVGTATRRQVDIHQAVAHAQREIVDLLRPGLSFRDYRQKGDEIMQAALRSLDLLEQPGDYRRYFPHAISHGLGVDVHDSLGGYDTFKPGMVLTVEPGVYLPDENIGVRLEDDILITETGSQNLSGSLSLDM